MGRYRDGTQQTDIQLLYNFIQICKDYGGYDGEYVLCTLVCVYTGYSLAGLIYPGITPGPQTNTYDCISFFVDLPTNLVNNDDQKLIIILLYNVGIHASFFY